jgi:hypothetical protein
MAEALATISQVDDLGMIQIRADLARAGDAIAGAAGLAIPTQGRAAVTDGTRRLGWMSPDELLLVLPRAEVADALAALTDALSTEHALVAGCQRHARRVPHSGRARRCRFWPSSARPISPPCRGRPAPHPRRTGRLRHLARGRAAMC